MFLCQNKSLHMREDTVTAGHFFMVRSGLHLLQVDWMKVYIQRWAVTVEHACAKCGRAGFHGCCVFLQVHHFYQLIISKQTKPRNCQHERFYPFHSSISADFCFSRKLFHCGPRRTTRWDWQPTSNMEHVRLEHFDGLMVFSVCCEAWQVKSHQALMVSWSRQQTQVHKLMKCREKNKGY